MQLLAQSGLKSSIPFVYLVQLSHTSIIPGVTFVCLFKPRHRKNIYYSVGKGSGHITRVSTISSYIVPPKIFYTPTSGKHKKAKHTTLPYHNTMCGNLTVFYAIRSIKTSTDLRKLSSKTCVW